MRRSTPKDSIAVRLREAEETLAAIRRGDVDAVVVRGGDGERVYTLQGADHPYRLFIEQMEEGALTLSEQGIILFCNKRFASLLNLPLEEVTGRNLTDALGADDRLRLARLLESVEGRTELMLSSPGQPPRPVAISAHELVVDEQRLVCAVVVDLTERRLAEAERERFLHVEVARAEAERANQVKDQFLAVLSHELRTPLSSMMIWLAVLKKGQSHKDSRRAIEAIQQGAELQMRLVNDLLDASRIVFGKLAVKEESVDLASVITASVEDARPAATAKDLRLSVRLETVPDPITGDGRRLQQSIANLLSNSIKFTPAGGAIVIRLTSRDDMACVQVEDTGVGIAPEFLPYVFERFRQADSTSIRQFEGLGLGLSIVKYLVEAHGGQVEAASEGLGKGSTFSIRIPLRPASLPVSPATPEAKAGPRVLEGVRLLLIEDDANTREALTMVLQWSGAQVQAAASVPEAQRAFAEMHPDAIISDIALPGENGYDFIRHIRKTGDAHVPAIAISGFASNNDRDEALRAGFDEHLPKPMRAEELIVKVQQLVRRLGSHA